MCATRVETKFNAIAKELPYNPAWANGTGYFNNAISGPSAVTLAIGEEAKSVDEHGRKLLFFGTRLGPVCIFERHSDRKDVIVSNTGRKFLGTEFIERGNISDSNLHVLLGHNYEGQVDNIGFYIERLAKKLNESIL
jgi:hypothetical protein